MRILFVIPYFYPALVFGGPLQFVLDTGRELVKRGHEVFVYTSDAMNLENRLGIKNAEIEGVKVYYFRNLSMFFVKKSKLFITPQLFTKMTHAARSFDVVDCHEFRSFQNILVYNCVKKHSIPYIINPHGSVPRIGRHYRSWIYDVLFGCKILRNASKVVALTKSDAHHIRAIGVPEDNIAIIPSGINLSSYSLLPPKGSFREKYGIDGGEKIILYLGRIHKSKGVALLIKAYAYLVKNLKFEEGVLVIAGPDEGFLLEAKTLITSG